MIHHYFLIGYFKNIAGQVRDYAMPVQYLYYGIL